MTSTRKLQFQNYLVTASSFVGDVGSLFFDPTTTTLRIGDGETAGGNVVGSSSMPIITVTFAGDSQSANNSVGGIGSSGISWFAGGAADVLYSVTSTTTVTATGAACFAAGGVATTATGAAGTGANGVRFSTGDDTADFVALVYATNSSGTAYAPPAAGTSRPLCLAAGTSIALSDGTYKFIEDITYDDDILVWNFDHGVFASSKPLWIKAPSPAQSYNLLTFDDGSTLSTVGQHRVFNKEAGRFTYPLTDDTPIGTMTYNQFGREVTLIEKRVVTIGTVGYNVITDYHLNLFANGILTSTSFNNIYPIVDMKFVKDGRGMRQNIFATIPDRFYFGMRLWEQTHDEADIERYIRRLLTTEAVNTLVEA